MKRKNILLFVLLGVFAYSCTEDTLDTVPTDKTTKEEVFKTVENAYSTINGIYRAFYVADDIWSDSYGTENFGIASVNLASDLMGDDLLMHEQGSAWFWYDYRYWVRTEVNSTSDRPFVWWNMFYKHINNANYVLANIDAAKGEEVERNNVKGQAHAIRAFAYLHLIQFYQRTYIGHENDPGVPLYTEPTTKETEGKGRGTVEEVYTQINSDLDAAIALLKKASPQRHKSHIDLYVAYGLKARVAMVQNKWGDAASFAKLAREKSGLEKMTKAELQGGFNTVNASGWMWGSEINEDQSTSWYSFFNHMDAGVEGHGYKARKCISKWLYDQIGDNDVRKTWFKGAIPEEEEESKGVNVSYNQMKFRVKSAGSWASDYIYMRVAEMYLIQAEAECRLGNFGTARTLLKEVISYKDPDFDSVVDAVSDGTTLNLNTAGPVLNLLDLIILQRRIELWGEGFRVQDIMRLKTGFDRNYDGTNHKDKTTISDPESWEWIMMIPQKEFDGNINMDPTKDQNP
ncbi:MAG: RagB/SusD family nutrient uptake outer membrane protein [Marinifilaceae bacterium]